MEFEMLASGYGLLEAPRVDDLGRLYFTDIPNGGIYRRNPGGNVANGCARRIFLNWLIRTPNCLPRNGTGCSLAGCGKWNVARRNFGRKMGHGRQPLQS